MQFSDFSGQRLGDYQLQQLIGKGGMGMVYESYQASVNRRVAIKILPTHLSEQEGYIKRFEREVELTARLEHPHILPVYDYGVVDDVAYVVMRLITGGTLEEHIKRERERPIKHILRFLEHIADALDYAHRQGVIHRDIKANNILFDEGGNAYLADFGIAKVGDGSSLGVTRSNQVIGTPLYMSPEQWKSATLDHRSDLYSLGILVYLILTGEFPFESDTVFNMMHNHVYETPASISEKVGKYPEEVDVVMSTILAKDRDDRYDSAGLFIQELATALGEESSLILRETPPVIDNNATTEARTKGNIIKQTRIREKTQEIAPAKVDTNLETVKSSRKRPIRMMVASIIAILLAIGIAYALVGTVPKEEPASDIIIDITSITEIETLPYSEDFDSGISNIWEGDWNVADGVLRSSDGFFGFNLPEADYSLQYDVRYVGGESFILSNIIGFPEENWAYMLRITDKHIALIAVQDKLPDFYHPIALSDHDLPIADNNWHTITLTISDLRIQVQIDDTFVFETKPKFITQLDKMFSFLVDPFRTQVEIDNLDIQEASLLTNRESQTLAFDPYHFRDEFDKDFNTALWVRRDSETVKIEDERLRIEDRGFAALDLGIADAIIRFDITASQIGQSILRVGLRNWGNGWRFSAIITSEHVGIVASNDHLNIVDEIIATAPLSEPIENDIPTHFEIGIQDNQLGMFVNRTPVMKLTFDRSLNLLGSILFNSLEDSIVQFDNFSLGCSRLKTHQDMVDCSWYI
jgi:serine/threonine protein kinase